MAVPDVAVASVDEGFWTRTRKVGVVLLALGLLATVLFGALATGEQARFTLSEDAAGAALEVNGTVGAIVFGLITLAAGAAMLTRLPKRWFLPVLAVGLVAFVLSFLCWQVSAAPAGQNFMPLVNIVRGTFLLALPLIFGALAGVLCERSGVVNVAIEGQLLMGAFSGALFGSISGNVWVGLVAAAIGGSFISLLLAVFSIKYLVDQVVMGIVLNLLALGITGFLYERLMQTNSERYNSAPGSATGRSRCCRTSRCWARRCSGATSSSTSPCCWCSSSTSRCSVPGGGCGPVRSVSTRRRRTPSA